ncbi:alpha/beta hydrolase [bacterium]|nr:alpha/beta hydrolase [bacterium]
MRYFMQQADGYVASVPYGDNIEAGHYVMQEDANIYYEIYGEGRPFVVLHGGGVGCAYEMAQFIDKLKDYCRVIVISTRGHGRSEIGVTPFSLDQRADDIKAVLDNENIEEPVVMMGFSDGGYSGYAFAALYPDRIFKLITIGAGEIPPTGQFFVFDLDEWRKADNDFIEEQQRIRPEPERWPEMLKMYERMWNNTVVSKELLRRVHCPVLLINGELDIHSPLLSAVSAYQMLENAQLAIIPGASHVCFADNFKAVQECMIPFLTKQTYSA